MHRLLHLAAGLCVAMIAGGAIAQQSGGAFTPGASPKAARSALGLAPDTGVAPRRNKLTFGPSGWVLANGPLGSTTTYFYALFVPDDAYAIRFAVPILSGSSGTQVLAARYRPSASISGAAGDAYVNPDDAGCVMGGSCWNYITFCEKGAAGGDSGDRLHEYGDGNACAQGTPPAGLSLPGFVTPDPLTGATTHARIQWSDWMNLITVPRTDVAATSPRIVMVRVVVPSGTTTTRCGGSPNDNTESGSVWLGNATLNNGLDYSAKSKTGDIETTANVTGTTAGTGDVGPACWFQVLIRNKGVQITGAYGDSHLLGVQTTGNIAYWALRAAAQLYSQSLPVWYAGAGWSGATSNQFIPTGQDLLDASDCSICILHSWTANDAITAFGTGQFLSRVLAQAQRLVKRGAKVVLMAPFPRNTLAGASLTAWQNLYTEVLGMTDAGVYVFNATAVLGQFSGSTPTGQYQPSLVAGGGNHPNDAGAAAMAAAFLPKLKTLIGCDQGSACP